MHDNCSWHACSSFSHFWTQKLKITTHAAYVHTLLHFRSFPTLLGWVGVRGGVGWGGGCVIFPVVIMMQGWQTVQRPKSRQLWRLQLTAAATLHFTGWSLHLLSHLLPPVCGEGTAALTIMTVFISGTLKKLNYPHHSRHVAVHSYVQFLYTHASQAPLIFSHARPDMLAQAHTTLNFHPCTPWHACTSTHNP